jgi:hypothetical protein
MTNGLEPHLLIEKNGNDWSVEIDFLAQTNFPKNTWLKITNRIGSKLQCWLTSGVELPSTNPSVVAATQLPPQTTVLDIMNSVRPSHTRGLQWLFTRPGSLSGVTAFNLHDVFGFSLTNDLVLQVSPLLYRVGTNGVTAYLVEFPPIRIRFASTGDVRKEE